MEEEKFDPVRYRMDWNKKNMKTISGLYRKEFVDEFKEACKVLGITQSSVFREAMEETIRKAKEHGQ